MKIAVLVKVVPNTDEFKYDYEKNILIRSNIKMILNPDDACAIEYALKLKDKDENATIELITMAPRSVISILEDLLRRNIDKATLISDKKFQGSDTFATSMILSKYIEGEKYDLILGGTNTLDGDTGHVINQVAECLDIWSFSNVLDFNVKEEGISFKAIMDDDIIECEYNKSTDETIMFGITRDSKKKLRYTRYDDLKLDVSHKMNIIDNETLKVDENIIGLTGSPTKVKKTFTKTYVKSEKELVRNDEEGIQKVYDLLINKGVIAQCTR
ncbi:MAG: electron transfer flavoprotein subunit beta/FixA family protein [Peptostreptococcaceae bacterium]